MKAAIAATVIAGLSCSATASDLTCTIKHGVYKFPVEAELMDALVRFPELKDETFAVVRHSGQVTASGFLSNEGEDVRVLRNIYLPTPSNMFEAPGLTNQTEIMSIAKNSGTKLLSIDLSNGELSFKYYFSMMGLLLTGPCVGT